MVELVIPKVSTWILGRDARKIIPVSGSFDDIHLASDSLDFAVEIDSLHHSRNLERTLHECARVLKPGGILVCLDRCHPNSLTDAQVEAMLDRVYPKEFLVANHYPPEVTLTRRDNGEHEYRMFEWERAFKGAGFRLAKTVHFRKEISWRIALKGALRRLPGALGARFRTSKSEAQQASSLWLRQLLGRLISRRDLLAPKEATAFLLEKP